eukprot:COSAG05_NODE_3187_length_2258_cov_1.250116_1_plen_160_part_00
MPPKKRRSPPSPASPQAGAGQAASASDMAEMAGLAGLAEILEDAEGEGDGHVGGQPDGEMPDNCPASPRPLKHLVRPRSGRFTCVPRGECHRALLYVTHITMRASVRGASAEVPKGWAEDKFVPLGYEVSGASRRSTSSARCSRRRRRRCARSWWTSTS